MATENFVLVTFQDQGAVNGLCIDTYQEMAPCVRPGPVSKWVSALKFAEVLQTNERISATRGPKFTIL